MWLTARSVARGLPTPAAEFGCLRLETNSEKEVTRWVFAEVVPGIRDLGRSIREPRYFIKLCGTEAELRETLPTHWIVKGGSWFMALDGEPAPSHPLPPGYEVETIRNGPVTRVEIRTNDGQLAAGGYAAETPEAFVYDRIETDPKLRRRGLGRAVVAALGGCRRSPAARQLLMATAEGERLYSNVGWRRLSPYSTAYLPEET